MRISDWSSDVCSSDLSAPRPLADQLRPARLGEVVGQDHLLGPQAPLGRMLAEGRLASLVLWGPPGCGKTTIARLLAHETNLHFEPLSAVFSGVADLRKVFDGARRRRQTGQGTQIGRAPVCTPVTNAPLVCPLLLEKK